MRKFKIFYHDNSGPKCEEFEGTEIWFEPKWLKLIAPHNSLYKIVVAIPTDAIYSVEEID